MAIEVDAVGGAVWNAVSLMVNRGSLTELMELLKLAPKENEVPRQISRHVATPTLLRSVLRTEPVDFDVVERLAESMGLDGARLLLDELAESESRAVRHGIFDRLAKMGVEIGPLVIERLNDKRWYVERNLLALLAEIEYWPDNFSLDSYIAHDELRIRREAIRYLLKIPGQRDQAILSALKQPDMILVRAGLMAVSDYGSEAAVPVIAKRIGEPDFPADLRIIAIRLLQRSKSTLALEALLRLVDGGKSLLNKPRLAETTPEMLTALGVLHSTWPRERRAAVFLEAARKSKSPEVRATVEGS
jgi:HEAT repeat protein